jgi:D-3-phosphoglycerate dehydrogenase|tara:strand:+ start:522 stop:1457 length:936 start_codon:yes stop_codon:yes gene_type:complete
MPKVLISDALSNLANEIFEKNNIEVDTITDLSPEGLKKIIENYDGLVVRSATKATDEIISAAKKLKIIGRAGAGVDNIDLISAKKNNVIVMNTPGGNTNATAEHTLSLLMSLYRNITEANRGTHKGLWEKKIFKGLELKGKKLGIVGFGNVGRRFSEIAISLGMEVSVFSESFKLHKDQFKNINSISFDQLIHKSDIISFHCKPLKNNKPMITITELKLMKKNAVILNTARGGLVDESDLKVALEDGIIRGAALDVFSQEPAKVNPLFGVKNIILTPHIAASTIEAQLVVAEQIAQQISDYFNSGKIVNSI